MHSFCNLSYEQVHSLFQVEYLPECDPVLPFSDVHYPFISLTSSSCLRLLRRPSVISILLSIFPSITCFKRQFLCKMWPIQLAFLLFTVCRIFLCSLTICISSSCTFNPLKPELNPICYLLALLGAYHFLHVSRIRVKLLTLR